jgi:hypothetical protein
VYAARARDHLTAVEKQLAEKQRAAKAQKGKKPPKPPAQPVQP